MIVKPAMYSSLPDSFGEVYGLNFVNGFVAYTNAYHNYS